MHILFLGSLFHSVLGSVCLFLFCTSVPILYLVRSCPWGSYSVLIPFPIWSCPGRVPVLFWFCFLGLLGLRGLGPFLSLGVVFWFWFVLVLVLFVS